ncbi:MAG: HK97 gp10 family phage protein [Chloroflexi bacterium]|nr:HK97 gp10 family phage protein [Chloroflexota bacterium]
MARGRANIRIVFNRFPEIARRAPETTRAAVAKAAHDIEAHAKMVVPVDTGNLKNSIHTVIEADGFRGVVATGVEYAPYVEYGTRRMGAKPYMTPAAERVRPEFIEAMKRIAKV